MQTLGVFVKFAATRPLDNRSIVKETPRSLLNRLAEHPAEADWRRLLDLYQPFIAKWLSQAGVPEADSPDLSQDVLTAVVKEMPTFRHNDHTGAFRKWLRIVVVNRTRDYWRKRNTTQTASDNSRLLDELEDPSSGLSGQWEREHNSHVSRQLLLMVKDEFAATTWAAFRMQVIDGIKAAEVAAKLEITVNAALIAKSRVLRRLREEADGLVEFA